MKSIQLYVCEHCGTKYKDKNECKKCESNHRAALEIHDMRFHACKDSDNYPDKVELKMADGKMIWYHRQIKILPVREWVIPFVRD